MIDIITWYWGRFRCRVFGRENATCRGSIKCWYRHHLDEE